MDKEGYELYIYDDCSVEVGYNGVILKDIESEFDLQKLLNKQDERIENLVSKLRVSNSQLANCKLEYEKLKLVFNQQEKLLGEKLASNSRLHLENQQLKEEIKQLNFDCAMYKSANYLINDIGIDKARVIMFQTEKKLQQFQNQKAIEVLEKVKTFCDNWKLFADYYNYVLVEETSGVRTMQTLYEYIDTQIAELRGGSEC